MNNTVKIKTRLIVGFSITIFFTIIVAVIASLSLGKSNDLMKELSQKQYVAADAAKMCRIYVNNAARAIRDMYIDEDPQKTAEHEVKVKDSLESVEKYMEVLKKNYIKNDGLVAEYESVLDGWMEIGTRALEGLDKGNHKEVKDILTDECVPALDKVVEVSQKLSDSTDEMKDEMLSKSLRNVNASRIFIIIIAFLSVIIGLALAFSITSGIVRPLYQIRDVVKEMSRGNLKQEVTYHGKDAVGEIAEEMRITLTTLDRYIDDIARAMAKMAEDDFNVEASQPFIGDFEEIEKSIYSFVTKMCGTIRNIRSTADQVAESSEQISNGGRTLSDGAAEQASAVEELAANLNAISSVVQKNAGDAKEASDKAKNAGEVMNTSTEQMQEMILAMGEISQNSSEIAKIIKTIEDIAFQTNILALNAAVEAARAGQAGKGFAVVADEVRNLASKSAEASKDTATMIEKSIKSVENGTRIAGVTDESLSQAVVRVKEIVSLVENIAESSDAQAGSIHQVTQGIDQISGVVQTNSATAEESAASSEELSGQAAVLKELVDKFKLINEAAE